jgi:hypothetical protein
MSKRTHRQAQTPYYPDSVFYTLRSSLHGLLGKSDTKCAKAMGVSRTTWIAWRTKPPRNPWLIFSLYWCCYIHLHQSHGRYKSQKWQKHYEIVHRLAGLHSFFTEHVPAMETIDAYSGCEKHLARLLCRKGMYWEDIRSPAHAGGYSARQLRIAARRLGVTMTQKGFGEDNESWWEWV